MPSLSAKINMIQNSSDKDITFHDLNIVILQDEIFLPGIILIIFSFEFIECTSMFLNRL